MTRAISEAETKAPTQANRKPSIFFWMGLAFGVALALAAAVLALKGSQNGLVPALRLTARWSFLLFWVAYSGGATAQLFGPAFKPLAARGREFGLAYAAAMLIHLGLVVWLFQISVRPPLSGRPFVFFSIGMIWTYLLALFSFGGLTKVLGTRGWPRLRIVAMNYILFAFALDFVPATFRGIAHYGVWLQYAPFAAMCIAAPLLVLAATARRRLEPGYDRIRFGPVPQLMK